MQRLSTTSAAEAACPFRDEPDQARLRQVDPPMTLFLASVRDPIEAGIALGARADIIDLKEPRRGALGAIDADTTRAIVGAIAGRAPVSATIGDVAMQPEAIREAVLARAACGVDFVKFGLFLDGDPVACLEALRAVARGVRLIMVVFVDRPPPFDAVRAAAGLSAAGIMLDTAGKTSGSLLDHLDLRAVGRFLEKARAQGLITGLAGSLRPADVAKLLPLGPDLLGFRGALCHGSRGSGLDPAACNAIRGLIPQAALPPASKPGAKFTGAAA
jgi:(5-formylfuran-3-yl)methyl phosphate synthase